MLERRDRAKVAALILAMIITPLGISYVYANMSGWNTSTVVTYNVTDHTEGSSKQPDWRIYNTTAYYGHNLDYPVYDNDTGSMTFIALPHDHMATIGDVDSSFIRIPLNTSFGADITFSRIVFAWTYVGTGNITDLKFHQTDPTVKTYFDVEQDFDSIDTYTYTPEAFEGVQLSLGTDMDTYIYFNEDANQPIVTDVLVFTVTFYQSTAILTQTQLLQLLAGGAGVMFFIAGVAISPLWNPSKKSYSRR